MKSDSTVEGDQDTIAALAKRARRLFWCFEGTEDENIRLEADRQLVRLNLWASNIGCFAARHSSLDYRLRTAPYVKAAVVGKLEILCSDIISVITGSPEVADDKLEELDATGDDNPVFQELALLCKALSFGIETLSASLNSIKASISDLHKLSLSIRKASNRQSRSRAPDLSDFDEGFTRKDGIFIEPIVFATNAPFRVFVKRVLEARWKVAGQNLSNECESYREAMFERCVDLICIRRQQLQYFRDHQRRLSRQTNTKLLIVEHIKTSMPLDLPQIHTPSEIGSHFRETPAVDLNDQMPSETAPSEFVAERYESRVKSEDTSSVASSSGGGLRSGGVSEIPPPPKLGSEEKEKQCPYCQLVLPARTFNEKRWARHLLEDLQPYYCLYKSCKQPDKTFTRYKSWTNHLSQPHSEPGSGHSPEILPLVCFVCLTEQSSITTLAMHMKPHLSSVSVLALPARDDLDSSRTDSDGFSSGKASENITISSHDNDLPELFNDRLGSGESSERKNFALGLHAREGDGAYQDSENLTQWAANTDAETAELAQSSIPRSDATNEMPIQIPFDDSDDESGTQSPITTQPDERLRMRMRPSVNPTERLLTNTRRTSFDSHITNFDNDSVLHEQPAPRRMILQGNRFPRKSQRMDASAPGPDDLAQLVLPANMREVTAEPLIDEATRRLGTSWTRMDASETRQINQAAYTKFIVKHYPALREVSIWFENAALPGYLVQSLNVYSGETEFYLFSNDLTEARLVTRDATQLIPRLQMLPALHLAAPSGQIKAEMSPITIAHNEISGYVKKEVENSGMLRDRERDYVVPSEYDPTPSDPEGICAAHSIKVD